MLASPTAAAAGRRCCAVACNLLTAVAEGDFADGAILDDDTRVDRERLDDECARRPVVADAEAALVAKRRIVVSGEDGETKGGLGGMDGQGCCSLAHSMRCGSKRRRYY